MRPNSKATTNTQAVDERQSLQTLNREEKTAARALSSLQEASTRQEEKKIELETEIASLKERKEEVWIFDPLWEIFLNIRQHSHKLDEKLKSLQSDYARAKQDLNTQQSEYARITYVPYEPFCRPLG